MNGKAAIFSEDGGLITHRRCRLNLGMAKLVKYPIKTLKIKFRFLVE